MFLRKNKIKLHVLRPIWTAALRWFLPPHPPHPLPHSDSRLIQQTSKEHFLVDCIRNDKYSVCEGTSDWTNNLALFGFFCLFCLFFLIRNTMYKQMASSSSLKLEHSAIASCTSILQLCYLSFPWIFSIIDRPLQYPFILPKQKNTTAVWFLSKVDWSVPHI